MDNQADIMKHLSPPSLPDRRAFTLTELLVLISMIAILILTQLSAIAKTLTKTQDLRCINNVKQLALSVTMYLNDHSGTMPGYQNIYGWIRQLQTNYSITQAVRCCPAAPEKLPWGGPSGNASPSSIQPAAFGTADYPWCWINWSSGSFDAQGSYGYNGWCYTADGNQGGAPNGYYLKDTGIVSGSKTPFFADAVWVEGWPDPSDSPNTDLYSGKNDGGLGRLAIARHGWKGAANAPRSVPANSVLPGQNNVGFADGHVEPVKLNGLWSLYWNKTWPR
jgi:prepilin-type processing-associated H-X9-DG protein